MSGSVKSLREAVREAVRTLAAAGVESAEFDAVALAACAGRTTAENVRKLMIMGAPVPAGFGDLVSERARRIPLQHLTGKAGFRRLELSVGPGVFVPRFETELTAGLAITFLQHQLDKNQAEKNEVGENEVGEIQVGQNQVGENEVGEIQVGQNQVGEIQVGEIQVGEIQVGQNQVGQNFVDKPRDGAQESSANLGIVRRTVPRFAGENPTPSLGLRDGAGLAGTPVVVDLCAGSGAIALAVKDEVPFAEVHAVELSGLAHAWAVRNRDDLGLEVDFRLGDAVLAFPELEAGVDVVVSNPPYIPVGSTPNDPEVRDHDPDVALYGGSSDGLRIPLEVAARAAVLLRPGGFFVMEHADVQGDSLTAALRATGLWQDVEDHADLNGRPRAVTAVRAR